MSEYILNTSAQTSKLDWAFPFQRTGAFPIDRSSIFSSLTDAKNYAKGVADGEKPLDERGLAGTSYVGQTVSVYNETDNTVSLFIITPDRNLKEIGNSIIADTISVEVSDNEIKLKDFGKGYYSYMPSQTDENGEVISEGEYVYIEGFKEGLEPRVALNEDNQLVLGWYEPSNENIEEISLTINNLINELEKIQSEIGNPVQDEQSATGIYKILEGKAEASNVYTKDEVYTKQETLERISEAGHLKRVKVDSKDDINVSEKGADNIIYMVPTGLQFEDDKYDEYIVLDGKLEKVGSWEVDLNGYAKEETVTTLLAGKVDKVENSRLMTDEEGDKLQSIEAGAEKNIVSSVSSDFSITEEGQLNLNTLAKSKIDGLVSDLTNITNSIADKVDKVEGSRLISTAEIEKLSAIKDLIQNIDINKFTLDENGTLLLKDIKITEIEGLVDALANKVDKVEGSRLITREEAEKLEALSVDDDGSVGISATVNATKVQELYNTIVNIVTGSGTGRYDGENKNLLNIEAGAEKNYISAVNETEFKVENRALEINAIPISKVTSLSVELASKATSSEVKNVADLLNAKAAMYEARFTDIEDRLTWKKI